jgi:putative sigma-54 modulation protein
MIIEFQSVNYNADSKLIEFTNKRVQKFERFFDRIVSVKVFTKVSNSSDKVNKEAEISISVPGDNFIVKKTCKSFEEAVDSCASSAERLLMKFKERARENAQ